MNTPQTFTLGDIIQWDKTAYSEFRGIVQAISADGKTLYVRQTYPQTRDRNHVVVAVSSARKITHSYVKPA